MIEENKLLNLIQNHCETKNLDYKKDFNWNDDRSKNCELIKDILSMANTKNGGHIIIGVRDSDYCFTGMIPKNHESFDQTKVNDLLEVYSEPRHICYVVKRIIDEKNVVCIIVPEFKGFPVVCKKEYKDKYNKTILERAALYARTEKATSEKVNSIVEMSDIINMAVEKRQTELELERAKAKKMSGVMPKETKAVSNESITGVRLAKNVYAGVVCKKCGTSIGMLVGSDKCPTCGTKIGD